MAIGRDELAGVDFGTRAITADTALRLAAYFGRSAETWMALQTKHDLAVAREAMPA